MSRVAVRRRPPRHRTIFAATAFAIGIGLGGTPRALGESADVFSAALPGRDTAGPEGVRSSGSGSVSEQHGTGSYSFPIELPAGRQGVAPSLSLAYSSSGALRGGLAVGWDLSLPAIERDPTFPTEVRYRSSLGGGWTHLISNAVDPGAGAHYRDEIDSGSFALYTLSGGIWTVKTSDGVTRTFSPADTAARRWNITSEKDSFGNETKYFWSTTSIGLGSTLYMDTWLARVEWTSNAAAGLQAHAKVDLVPEPLEKCGGIPVGARLESHFGPDVVNLMYGSRRIKEINVSVRDTAGGAWRLTRRHTLGYDQAELACGDRTPLRYLKTITTTGYDQLNVPTSMPPLTFFYGPAKRSFASPVALGAVGKGDYGMYYGPSGALQDMDGDGVPDRTWMEINQRCTLKWKKGVAGGGTIGPVQSMQLPTAKWFGSDAGADFPSINEWCSLSGQVARRQNDYFESEGQWKNCQTYGVNVSYHFMDYDQDGLIDLLVNLYESRPSSGGRDFPWIGPTFGDGGGGGGGACPSSPDTHTYSQCTCPAGEHYVSNCGCEPPCPAGTIPDPLQCGPQCTDCADIENCTGGGGGGGGGSNGDAPPHCEAMWPVPEQNGTDYVWRVFRNQGNGQLEGLTANGVDMSAARLVSSPLPLPANGSEMTVGAGELHAPMPPTLIDINGDGWLDVVATAMPGGQGMPGLGVGNALYVWPGPGWASGFGAVQTWTIPTWSAANEGTYGGSGQYYRRATVSFVDMNADGLVDIVTELQAGGNPGAINVLYNQLGTFSPPTPIGLFGDLDFSRMDLTAVFESIALKNGIHGFERRFMDMDADGLPEMMIFTTASGGMTLPPAARSLTRLAGGTPFFAGNLDPFFDVVRGVIVASDGAWYRRGDLVDLTGDGLPDSVTWAGNNATLRTDVAAAAPLRLLERVENGRGGVTRFEYASSTGTVTLQPGEHLAPRWLVKSVRVAPGFNQPEILTAYAYAGPLHGRDTALTPAPPPEFLGFSKVTVTSSGQQGNESLRVVKEFGVPLMSGDRDHTPRLLAETTLARNVTTVERRIRRVEHSYANEQLLYAGVVPGAPSFTYETKLIDRTYAADGVTEAGVRSVVDGWTAKYRGTVKMLLVHDSTKEGAGELPTSYRLTTTSYQTRFLQAPYATSDYRVLPLIEQVHAASPYMAIAIARAETVPDVATGLPFESRVYQSVTLFASTVRTFDAQTGNLLTVKRPTQVAAGGNKVTTYTYDTHRLKVSKTTNELSHTTTDFYDYGSDALVRREGPNWRIVSTSGCGMLMCVSAVPEVETFKLDGLGRVVQHWVSADPTDGSAGYVQKLLESAQYIDNVLPTRRISSKNVYADGSVVAISEEQYDGEGRLLSRTDRRQIAGQPDAVTSYRYDAGGELARVDAPDPRVDTGATVPWTYVRDGLGRVVRFERPDGSAELVSYDGVTNMVQATSPGDGPGTRTTQVKDVFGRLVQVREHDTPVPGAAPGSPGVDAVTTYGYDWLDHMTSITNADGQLTAMSHDWAGNRLSITRGARTWTYQYDLGNNIKNAISPVPAGAPIAEYTSINTYDELDRPSKHTPATRGMSLIRRTTLGIGTVTFIYDTNAIGQFVQLQMPFGRIDYSYDARHQLKREVRTINFPGFTRSQIVDRTSNLVNQPMSASWDDGTRWAWDYDKRGLLRSLGWKAPASATTVEVATYDRSLAGAPRHRTSGYFQTRDWTYDELGRVVEDKVRHTQSGQVYGWRTYGYDGFGELEVISGTTGSMSTDAIFQYDARGRLERAQGPIGYDGGFSYSLAGNVHTAAVAGAADVPTRNVQYAYGVVDPQAVDRLFDLNGGPDVATLTYDVSGNLTKRVVPDGIFNLSWDGDDKLREVAGPDGTEIYWFGPNGERMAAITPSVVKMWFAESETHFTASGTQLVRWHHVAAGEPLVRFENGVPAELQYADALQNLMLSIHTDGTLKAAFVYGGFGEVVGQVGEDDHRRQFNGKENDMISGLRHYGFRSYDPVLLRWVSADPMYRFVPDAASSEPLRANLYAFSMNNPLRYYDPDGRDGVSAEPQDEAKRKRRGKSQKEPDPGKSRVRSAGKHKIACKVKACSAYRIYILRQEKATGSAMDDALEYALTIAEVAGYEAVLVNDATERDFDDARTDPMAVGVITDSHGGIDHISLGSESVDTVYDSDQKETSDSVQFVVMVSCGAGNGVQNFADHMGVAVYGYTQSIIWSDVQADNMVERAFMEHLPGYKAASKGFDAARKDAAIADHYGHNF